MGLVYPPLISLSLPSEGLTYVTSKTIFNFFIHTDSVSIFMYSVNITWGYFWHPFPFLCGHRIWKPRHPNRPPHRWRRNPLSFHPRHARTREATETVSYKGGQNHGAHLNQIHLIPRPISVPTPVKQSWFCSLYRFDFKPMLISAGQSDVGVLFCKCMSLVIQ